jgi:histone H2B
MLVRNSFVIAIFERIATEGVRLFDMNDRKTFGSREVQTAVRLVLQSDLAKSAASEGDCEIECRETARSRFMSDLKKVELFEVEFSGIWLSAI